LRLEDRPDSVRFALAAAAEALMSLHVTLYPKIHALQHPWIRAMHRVSPALKREIRAFAFSFADAFADCFVPTGPSMTFHDQLAVLQSLSDEQAAHELARPLFFYWKPEAGGPERLSDPALRDGAVSFARDTGGEEGAELVALAFEAPACYATGSSPCSSATGARPSRSSGSDWSRCSRNRLRRVASE
jgi:Family of unknown function (DUF5937)